MGVPVVFQTMIFLPDADTPVETSGDDGSSQQAMKVLHGSSQNTAITDVYGLASLAPSTGPSRARWRSRLRPAREQGQPCSSNCYAVGDGAQSRRKHRESARSGATESPTRRGRKTPQSESTSVFEGVSRETRFWCWPLSVLMENYEVDSGPVAPRSEVSESEPSEPKTSAKSVLHPAGRTRHARPNLATWRRKNKTHGASALRVTARLRTPTGEDPSTGLRAGCPSLD
jgi:hypothetical protein